MGLRKSAAELCSRGYRPAFFMWNGFAVWQELFTALALVLVLEGILPFLSPRGFKESMRMVADMQEKSLRMLGFAAMLIGLLILYFAR
jgi:uncharacterized protein YjeT (DUF2065 family)